MESVRRSDFANLCFGKKWRQYLPQFCKYTQ